MQGPVKSIRQESERERWMATSRTLEGKETFYHELISCLNCHFARELGYTEGFFYNVFGSVLADLPEEVFKEICSMKNLFFVYTPYPRAETKIFQLKNDITERTLQIVIFPFDSDFLPSMVLRGEIVRELVRVHRGLVDVVEQEQRIDAISKEWGFREEIEALREYKRGRKSEKKPHCLRTEKGRLSSRTQESWVLIMRHEEMSQETVLNIERVVTSIGRGLRNDIVLEHPMVSRRHAEICFEDEGYFLYDIASKNGTRLNGRYIHKEKLSDGDTIQIGPFTFTPKLST